MSKTMCIPRHRSISLLSAQLGALSPPPPILDMAFFARSIVVRGIHIHHAGVANWRRPLPLSSNLNPLRQHMGHGAVTIGAARMPEHRHHREPGVVRLDLLRNSERAGSGLNGGGTGRPRVSIRHRPGVACRCGAHRSNHGNGQPVGHRASNESRMMPHWDSLSRGDNCFGARPLATSRREPDLAVLRETRLRLSRLQRGAAH